MGFRAGKYGWQQAFRVGDWAELKCGSQPFVVRRIERGSVSAEWFDVVGKRCRLMLDCDTIKHTNKAAVR